MRRRNPPWVDELLAKVEPSLASMVPPEWLPTKVLRHVPPQPPDPDWGGLDEGYAGGTVPTYPELGCGGYGCVLATHDPHVVLKLTKDHS